MSLNCTSARMYCCRQLQQLCTKWTLLIAVCTLATICFYRPFVSNKGPIRSMDEKETKPNVQIKHYDVLLSSYMSSGSTLTGIILGWRTDTFYLYEPLWKLSEWTYWRGNNTICRADRLDCRTVDPGDAVKDKSFPNNRDNGSPCSLEMAMKILGNIYDCQFNDLERTVVDPKLTVIKGGPSWSQMAACIKKMDILNYASIGIFQEHVRTLITESQ